jgi:hypothetical protein
MASVTGWELYEPQNHLPAHRTNVVSTFVEQYQGCAALSPDGQTLVIIRRYHPTLNMAPDDSPNADSTYVVGLAYYRQGMYTWFYLPKSYAYSAIRVSDDIPAVVEIDTVENGTIVTNIQELHRKLANMRAGGGVASEEAWLVENFAQLANVVVPPAPVIPITQNVIDLGPPVGQLHAVSGMSGWWTNDAVAVAYFDRSLPVTLMECNPQDPSQEGFVAKASHAISQFLLLNESDRLSASQQVNAYCQDFIEAVGVEDWNEEMAAITNPDDVWKFVDPREVLISYSESRDAMFIVLSCECDWEEEHGLQLIYREGNELVRVSDQDGHYTD